MVRQGAVPWIGIVLYTIAPGLLVVVPARDEEQVIAGCLTSLAESVEEVELPVVVMVVLHRCADGTVDRVDEVVRTRPGVHWVVEDSGAKTRGGARAEGVGAGRHNEAMVLLDPATVWLASTDADSRVPPTWLGAQVELADRGLAWDLAPGSRARTGQDPVPVRGGGSRGPGPASGADARRPGGGVHSCRRGDRRHHAEGAPVDGRITPGPVRVGLPPPEMRSVEA